MSVLLPTPALPVMATVRHALPVRERGAHISRLDAAADLREKTRQRQAIALL